MHKCNVLPIADTFETDDFLLPSDEEDLSGRDFLASSKGVSKSFSSSDEEASTCFLRLVFDVVFFVGTTVLVSAL